MNLTHLLPLLKRVGTPIGILRRFLVLAETPLLDELIQDDILGKTLKVPLLNDLLMSTVLTSNMRYLLLHQLLKTGSAAVVLAMRHHAGATVSRELLLAKAAGQLFSFLHFINLYLFKSQERIYFNA
jgi:Arc/MetJ family transcription regulator